jgi:DNA gyrase subunit A
MDSLEDGGFREDGVQAVEYNSEMSTSYVTYAMSVIVSRALPDVRDGLKPVHRRILYAMMVEGEFTSSKKKQKSARAVGEVMGKFHPHGDSAIYDAFVRMAQKWKMRHVLIDGQGNFGSVDNDPAAAMRYTEARMAQLAHELTDDVGDGKRTTVRMDPNYDESRVEPAVLPARFPNILVNGGSGIAVGMATSIPTHNLREVIDATLLLMGRPDASLEEIMEVMPGPDFPTRGIILGLAGIRQAYSTGRGPITVSGVAHVEDAGRGRSRIAITELPYDVVKSDFIGSVAQLVRERRMEKKEKEKLGTADTERGRFFDSMTEIRDETDRSGGIRVVIELRAESDPSIVINGLRRFTAFQSNFSCNMTCLSGGERPEVMGVHQMITEWIAFRRETVSTIKSHELDEARDSQLKQIAMYAATSDIDAVVQLIKESRDRDLARARLMERDFDASEELVGFIRDADPDATLAARFKLTETQADSILRLNLGQLTGLSREEIANELRELAGKIRGLLEIVSSPERLDEVIRNDLNRIRNKYGDDRRTIIEPTEADAIDDESLIERKDVVVSLTRGNYVKRTDLAAYRSQRRGGKGRTGMETKDDDFVIASIVCTTKTPLLVFTAKGQVYAIKAWRFQDANPNAKGRHIGQYIELSGDRVVALVPLPESRDDVEGRNLVFVTDFGSVRRNLASDFLDINRKGKIAMKFDEGGSGGALVAVLLAKDGDDVMMATSAGNVIRFPVTDVRLFSGRDSTGVRGIQLKGPDKVVDAAILTHVDALPVERDIYLAGGVKIVSAKVFTDDQGNSVAMPATVTSSPAEPGEDGEPRHVLTLDAVRMGEMQETEGFLLTVTENGFGKRSSTHDYRVANRGGLGIKGAVINETTGNLVSCLLANDRDGLVLVTDGAMTIRTGANDIRVLARVSRGVRLLAVPDGQRLVAVARIPADDDELGEAAAPVDEFGIAVYDAAIEAHEAKEAPPETDVSAPGGEE